MLAIDIFPQAALAFTLKNVKPKTTIAETNSFLIVLALAGFSANDLMIEATSTELVVCGNGDKIGQHEYIHKGIAKRAFTKTFRLADSVIVDGAEFKDGLLSIYLYTMYINTRIFPYMGTINMA